MFKQNKKKCKHYHYTTLKYLYFRLGKLLLIMISNRKAEDNWYLRISYGISNVLIGEFNWKHFSKANTAGDWNEKARLEIRKGWCVGWGGSKISYSCNRWWQVNNEPLIIHLGGGGELIAGDQGTAHRGQTFKCYSNFSRFSLDRF